ncbi:MAG: filamentous hemagglutinin N-terminal domain-containing protein, partial [Betaproteobacteria bacterium]
MITWLASTFAYGNPVGPVVVNGQAKFARNGSQLAITNTPGAIINWQQFSIGASETTRFIQQSAASSVLNRVVGVDPTVLLGTLQSNGRVFLINPNGILFGAGSRIDVAGLVASTLNLSNADFLAGRMNFTGDPARAAAVVNQGHISASTGGAVYLVGAAVENEGVITAPGGDIVLAAGKSVRITDERTARLQVEINAPEDHALNLSDAAYGSRGIYAGLVRNSGIVTADSVVKGADGRIVLKASRDATLTAGSSVTANGVDGGSIVLEAQQGAATVAGSVEATGTGGRG